MKYENIHWVSNEEYEHAVGQLKGALRGIMKPFNYYGMHLEVPGAIEEIVKVSVDFSLRLRGIDKPIRTKQVIGEIYEG